MDLETITEDFPIDSFINIGYSNLHDVILWWEDEKELHEEDSEEDIMMSFFCEKFSEVSNFMDIINDFSPQVKSELLDVYSDFLGIFDDYTPWEWFSWYIHMFHMSIITPASCPFHSGKISLPEHIQHFNYEGIVSKNIKLEEVNQFEEFIRLTMENTNHKSTLKVWYHGTNSVHAASIVRSIDLTVIRHFGHAFGFHRSFYIGNNLKYCLIRALKAAGTLSVNCALVVFCINESNLYLFQNYLKLICRKDFQENIAIDNVWEDIVPISKNSNSIQNNLDDDPIQSNVQWVEGANLKRSNGNWIPKKDDTIRFFRTDNSTQFLHSQLAFIFTFKNPRVRIIESEVNNS